MDTDVLSYVSKSVSSVLAAAEEEKKLKYGSAVEARHTSFMLFVVSVDGALGGGAAATFFHRLSDRLLLG